MSNMFSFFNLEDSGKTLSKLFIDKRVVIFTGAGTSFPQPSGIPTADQLKNMLLNLIMIKAGLTDEKLRKIVDTHFRLENFIQALTLRLGDAALEPFNEFESAKPNLIHHFIAGLAKRQLIDTVLTTNFDCLIEKAFSQNEVDFHVYCYPNNLNILPKNKIRLLKLHGSIVYPSNGTERTTLVATINRASMPIIPKIRDHLHGLLHDKIILYLGYSGRDYYDIYPLLFSLKHEYAIWIDHTDHEQFEALAKEDVWQRMKTRDYRERILFSNGDGIILKCKTEQIVRKTAEYMDINISLCKIQDKSFFNLHNWTNNFENCSFALLGDLYIFFDSHSEAIPYFKKYFKNCLAERNELDIAYASRKLGMCYEGIKNYDNAEKYYFQALELYTKNEIVEDELTVLSDIALLYDIKGNPQSLDICKKILLRMKQEKIEHPSCSATFNLVLGNFKLKEKEFVAAIQYYESAKLYYERSNNPPGIAMINKNIAYTYMHTGQNNKAVGFAEDALFFYGTPLNPRHGNHQTSDLANFYAINLLSCKGYAGAINYVLSNSLMKEMGIVREMIDVINFCNRICDSVLNTTFNYSLENIT